MHVISLYLVLHAFAATLMWWELNFNMCKPNRVWGFSLLVGPHSTANFNCSTLWKRTYQRLIFVNPILRWTFGMHIAVALSCGQGCGSYPISRGIGGGCQYHDVVRGAGHERAHGSLQTSQSRTAPSTIIRGNLQKCLFNSIWSDSSQIVCFYFLAFICH
jgi:hypothetical protein